MVVPKFLRVQSLAAALALLAACVPVREERRYREVLAVKSLAAAESYLQEFPDGKLRARLIEELRGWARDSADPRLVERVEQIVAEGGRP